MKKKLAKLIAASLAIVMIGTACNNDPPATDPQTPPAQTGDTGTEGTDTPGTDPGTETPPSDLDPMTIEVYSQAANFQGDQVGWTAKLLKDKFNITLNIIAPQVAGGEIFAARSAAGFLGDLVVLENDDIQSTIESNLIYDITEGMMGLEAFEDYKEQLDVYNASLEGVEEGQYYAWPTELANTSPVDFSPQVPGVSPTLPWDYYDEAGAPELENLNDLVDLLRTIQDNHPTNEAGDPSYGITLWPDWDGNSMENVNQLTKWYGEEVNGSILLNADGTMRDLVDDDGAYKKILKFYFDANQAGVIDPDSGTQNWDSVNNKFNSKRAFLIWNDWQRGFWNNTTRGEAGENYETVPIADMKLYQPSDPYFGSGRAFAVGTDDPAKQERVLMLMDWMSSPEGLEIIHGGIEGFNWVDSTEFEGRELTDAGQTALMDNSPVPEEYGGGLYADGMLQINQWMSHGVSINPNTGQPYGTVYWPSQLEMLRTTTWEGWSERFDADNPVEYLEEHDLLAVVPFVNVSLEPDTTDIALIRTNSGPIVTDTSWQMIFANSEEDFENLWQTMKEDLEGFGWQTLVEFDMNKYQAVVDAREEALSNN